MVQWLRLHASTEGGEGSIPGQGTKILHAKWCSQKNNNNDIGLAKKFIQLVNTLFNEILGENEKCDPFYFYLKPNELFGQYNNKILKKNHGLLSSAFQTSCIFLFSRTLTQNH